MHNDARSMQDLDEHLVYLYTTYKLHFIYPKKYKLFIYLKT